MLYTIVQLSFAHVSIIVQMLMTSYIDCHCHMSTKDITLTMLIICFSSYIDCHHHKPDSDITFRDAQRLLLQTDSDQHAYPINNCLGQCHHDHTAMDIVLITIDIDIDATSMTEPEYVAMLGSK